MAVTNYLWDDETDTVVMEQDGGGATQAVYHADPVPFGRLFSMRRGGTTYDYRYDAQGNTRALTDESGQLTDTYRYDAWGTPTAHTGTTQNPYRYGGQVGYQYVEATGVYSVRERFYEPNIARWRSKDPIASGFLEAFAYVANNPCLKFDPSGLVIPTLIKEVIKQISKKAAGGAVKTGAGLVALASVKVAHASDRCCDGIITSSGSTGAAGWGFDLGASSRAETRATRRLKSAGWGNIKWGSTTYLAYHIRCCVTVAGKPPTGEVTMNIYVYSELTATDFSAATGPWPTHFTRDRIFAATRTLHPGWFTPPDLAFSTLGCCVKCKPRTIPKPVSRITGYEKVKP